jgi:dCTP deaminase
MAALGFDAIKSRLEHSDPNLRLVVSPLLDPASQISKDQGAIDVRLGRSFAIVRPWSQGVADLVSPAAPEPPLEQLVVDFGMPLIIHPHQFVLARTLEFVRLPKDLLAYVIGRSSWGRRGLIVATATVVHPMFAGPITLELKNVGEVPLALYPMDRVAQIALHKVDGVPPDARPRSQFACTFTPGLGRARDAETAKAIKKAAP